MMIRPRSRTYAIAAVLAGAMGLTACATTATDPMRSTEFTPEAFAWSARPGTGSIEGRVSFVQDGKTFNCVGNVGLIPDTGYTRARMNRLYGSTQRAAVPAAVVRTRSAGEQVADYRAFERAEPCQNNSFRFNNLPDGSWFLISPVRADDEIMVLMRQVQTRNGRQVPVTVGN